MSAAKHNLATVAAVLILSAHGVPALEVSRPALVALARQPVPLTGAGGEVLNYKSAYIGKISAGSQQGPQEFDVVFDTASGQVFLPGPACGSKACVGKRRFNASKSATAVQVNGDRSEVKGRCDGQPCRDTARIEYGDGEVRGAFVEDLVCAGGAGQVRPGKAGCGRVTFFTALEMSDRPFGSVAFDGIVGIGLDSLSLRPQFNFLRSLAAPHGTGKPQFAIYLGGADGEVAFGGYNAMRLGAPLAWAPVVKPEDGFWQVRIRGVRVGAKTLDLCRGGCHGVLDTGSAQLGVPEGEVGRLAGHLSAPGFSRLDCRRAPAAPLHLDLDGLTLTLGPEDYMHRLPRLGAAAGPGKKACAPRLTPLSEKDWGARLLLLGEPVLRKYYTVFDWARKEVGFGLSTGRPSRADAEPRARPPARGEEAPDDDVIFLVQVTLRLSARSISC